MVTKGRKSGKASTGGGGRRRSKKSPTSAKKKKTLPRKIKLSNPVAAESPDARPKLSPAAMVESADLSGKDRPQEDHLEATGRTTSRADVAVFVGKAPKKVKKRVAKFWEQLGY
mmetsp:Transcript_32158/g.51777  ORF Transcript_32158/g.51777 Transcript_32158/m.51777 type:complete len:114 (-) Transcript_32158:197-538(-)